MDLFPDSIDIYSVSTMTAFVSTKYGVVLFLTLPRLPHFERPSTGEIFHFPLHSQEHSTNRLIHTADALLVETSRWSEGLS